MCIHSGKMSSVRIQSSARRDVTVEFKVIFQIFTGMAGASSQVFFEGTEKLLEVWFSSDSESPDLRDVKQLVSAIFFCTGFTYNRIYSLLNKFSSYRQLYCSLSLLILKCRTFFSFINLLNFKIYNNEGKNCKIFRNLNDVQES